ncbi:MAG: hypothetical protein BGO01_19335 [Armatimonadetes bacterium 55-13]|nr:MAG: hypothetical protein BGO01_19335 [Armatimonadetes bacterium 55-13]
MLKSLSNSKLFFVALGVTVALIGVRVSAAPPEPRLDSLERSVEKIADSLERIQLDGIDVKVSQKWSTDEFKVKVVK